jgi:hypothetical protein
MITSPDNNLFIDEQKKTILEWYATKIFKVINKIGEIQGWTTNVKSYDPLTIDLPTKVAHSYVLDLDDGGRHHKFDDLMHLERMMDDELIGLVGRLDCKCQNNASENANEARKQGGRMKVTRDQALYLAEAMLGSETVAVDVDGNEVLRPASPYVRYSIGFVLGENMPSSSDLQQNTTDAQKKRCTAFADLLRGVADAIEGSRK